MDVSVEISTQNTSTMQGLKSDRLPWWSMWRELADYYLPKRYVWLLSPKEQVRYLAKNSNILDGTGTNAGRILAAGMMNGITSPSRPWFKLGLAGYSDDADLVSRRWLDEVERRMMLVMSESNFYNALAVMYIDLVFFGSAAVIIYEDFESVIRCYNSALGEYYLGQSDRLQVNMFAREFSYKVHQVVARWGKENCSETVKNAVMLKGAALMNDIKISHLIKPNDGSYDIPKTLKYVECYWETGGETGKVLEVRGFNEMPGIFPRWELTGNDAYGTCPALEALGDVIQLQHETKRKGQSLDFFLRPPLIADVQLQHKPSALLPGGTTFVAGINNIGVKPAYQITPPIQELTMDIRDIQGRIRETFSNDLFQMISQLDTVRTATEIDARREEKLIRLGPVLERFENEALNPAIDRIYNIMSRAGLLPEPPPSIVNQHLKIQYVSIMSSAQSAVGVAPTERFLQLIGNIAPVYKEALNLPNFEKLLRDYARDIGVKASGINTVEEVAAKNAQSQQADAQNQALQQAQVGADAGKLLSETDVGGGANALQRLIGG